MTGKRRILVFEAHGDDMEFTCGGTVAKFIDRGHEVHLCVATDNDKGSFELTAEQLRAARDREVHGAAKVLGISSVTCLGYPDGELQEKVPLHVLRGQFMRLIRQLKADIIFTWDPFTPYEGHPDHRAVAWAAHEAACFANFPLYYPEQLKEGLEPYYVGEQWFFAKAPRDVNKYVVITEYIDKKLEALYQHESQMVLTVAGMQHHLRGSGLSFPPLEDLDPHNYREVIAEQIRRMAAAVGAQAGFTYAEAFRRERYGGIERIIGQTVEEDV